MANQFATATALIANETDDAYYYRTLVLGDIDRWQAAGRDIEAFGHFSFCSWSELSKTALEAFAPDIVLSPLIGDEFDVIVVAEKLAKLGFTGRYRAISFDTPNVAIIQADVAQIAPDLDFDILRMQPLGLVDNSNGG